MPIDKDDRIDVKEYVENEESLKHKVKLLAEKVKSANHVVVFTGAGISTSAKIPDFRGPKGVWTLREKGKVPEMEVTIEQAFPTYCHMSLVELQNQGILKYTISQNVDGLHRRSGIKPDLLSELHGNVYLEVCDDCGTEYLRNYSVCEHNSDEVDTSNMSFTEIRHMTGRRCSDEKCKGILRDTIIDFGESLPTYSLKQAKKNAKECDLMIVLGSSLTVYPACDLPKYSKEFVIVNLQKTQHDSLSSLRIFAKTDDVMRLLMSELGHEVPEFEIDNMRPCLVYQPTEENARLSRKPIPKIPNPIHVNDYDKINLDDLKFFEPHKASSCTIL